MNKTEIQKQIFMLMVTCILAKLPRFATILQNLYLAFLPTNGDQVANEIAFRTLNQIRDRLIDKGFDWETEQFELFI